MRNLWILSLLLVLCVCIGMSCAVTPVPKKAGKSYGPSTSKVQKAIPQMQYDRLLARYLSRARELSDAAEQKRVDRYIERAKESQQADLELAAKENEIVEKLRAESKRKPKHKLDFESMDDETPPYELTMLSATSPASARAFTRMYKEGLLDENGLLAGLAANAELMSPAWFPLIREIADKAKPGSFAWSSSAFCLYAAGASREKYRPILEQLAEEKGSWSCLWALLFETDRETGKIHAVQDQRNLVLLQKLAKSSPSYHLRLVCAEYAIGVGQVELAESICLDVLMVPYKGLSLPDGPASDEDHDLHRARSKAVRILFYQVRTERAFRAIYDLSHTRDIDAERERREPRGWRSLATYALGRFDIDYATSLIDEMEG